MRYAGVLMVVAMAALMPPMMPGIAVAEGGAGEGQVKGASAASPVKGASAVEFDHLAVYVHDVERSAAFYEKVMGLERIPDPFHDALHVWLRMGPGVALHVVGGAPATTVHAINDHFAFRMASLDGFMAKLDGLGIAYRNLKGDGKVAARVDGVRQIYLQDPDGYWIEVNEGKK